MKATLLLRSSALGSATFLMAACDVTYDMVAFHESGIMPAAATPVPKIAVDTNVTAGMFGGTVKSNKPYDIQAHYLDDSFSFASAEFTSVTVTYADGSTDPGIPALKLPMICRHTAYESSNSMSGGAVVVTKSRIIRAEFPATINRDEPFTLRIEGKFTKDDGSTIPFSLREKYDMSRDTRKESWVDFVSGC